ncbi:MAG: TetR/AcrR family transcriptional regulator [SAR324 cluster bacterium]|jgi:AcrR family transcriptional regulator|nr:TetR/AcrR family transcriptional regulator [SAR324 cluster bacterium]MDP7045924.1 TetR/AcrR family transcriptional regulator [SAR324 cluster bacterium]
MTSDEKNISLSRAKKSRFVKGQERIETILDAAREVFVESGYNKLTMRQVALVAGITVGNLNYYYQTKEALFRDMLDNILKSYLKEFDKIIEGTSAVPEERFTSIIEYLIQDLNTPATTKFFPELWALSNHNPYAAQLMNQMYTAERQVIFDLIDEVSPELKEESKRELALYISCSIEGMTMFVGAGKSHERSLTKMKKMASDTFLRIVKAK